MKKKTSLIVALSLALSLALAFVLRAPALGAGAPEFPFKNLREVGVSAPGLSVRGVTAAWCGEYFTDEYVYLAADGSTVWIVWVSGTHLTAGVSSPEDFLVGGLSNSWIYHGTVHPDTREITVGSVAPFRERGRDKPCEHWEGV